MSTYPEYKWSDHAGERFKSRFPDLDRDLTLRNAKHTGNKTKNKIKRMCSQSAAVYMASGKFSGRYYLLEPKSRAVFVIHAPNIVVTVLDLNRGAS